MTWLLSKQLRRYDKAMLFCVSHSSFPLAPIVGVCKITHFIISVGVVVMSIFSLTLFKSSFVQKKKLESMFSTMEISSIILGEVTDFKSRHLPFKFVDITTQEENLVVLQAHTL